MSTRVKIDNNVIVMFEGDLTVKHAEEMKADIVKALKNGELVGMTFEDITSVDLSCLQLLCSSHRSAVRLQKKMYFESCPPQILKDMADATGFLWLKGCTADCAKSCLWNAARGANHG
jgi:anti-anti-sigma regulatory factor